MRSKTHLKIIVPECNVYCLTFYVKTVNEPNTNNLLVINWLKPKQVKAEL